jgi:uncharacterized protein with ParB-like and HNH nuclease domain/uncharacterized protein YecA (UPF0149 family)
MEAAETNFQRLIDGTKQYVVPLFQRSYTWGKAHWQDLLNDLVDLYENTNTQQNHFIGSIVTSPMQSSPQSITQYMLIDGQQRLTTIFILLIVLRDIAKEETLIAEKINKRFLYNECEKGLDYYKLLPTSKQDRYAFIELIKGNSDINSPLNDCYKFFKHKINKFEVEKLYGIIINNLSIVSIALTANDNPYVVFEGLNAKGLALTQADLIRNYFFMRIDLAQQDEIYKDYWLPMQESFEDKLTEFMRNYLSSDGVSVKKDEVYLVLKKKVDNHKDAFAELKRIKDFSNYYNKIIFPEKEKSTDIREMLVRINRLGFTVVYPFLLNCYFHYSGTKEITEREFIEVLKILENFLIRRFVCNMPTHGLNKLFPALYTNSIKASLNFIDGLKIYLLSQKYPKDSDFRYSLKESTLYTKGDNSITRLILETLEDKFNNGEQHSFTDISIEHIMPQNLSKEWINQLGDTGQQDHDLYLNTLGNMTLILGKFNSESSNRLFKEKKQMLAKSNFSLNKYFSNIENWNKEAIEKRANHLADAALTIWEYFGEIKQIQNRNDNNVTGKKPNLLIISGDKFIVKSWTNIIVDVLSWIAEYEADCFNDLVRDYPRFISKSSTGIRKGKQLKNGYFVETNLSAERIYSFCNQAMQVVGLSNEDWKITFD